MNKQNNIIKLSNDEIKEFVDSFNDELLGSLKIKYKKEKDWAINNFPDEAGIYAIFDNNNLSYIGQTDNIRKRMSEVHRTYNHSFRKKLGRKLHPELTKNPQGKFEGKIEEELDDYFKDRISFRCKPLNFGRLEVEGRLIKKYQKEESKHLLNSVNKRIINDYE